MARFGGKSMRYVGLDIGSSSVKSVELTRKGSGYELQSIAMEPLAQDVVVDGAIMDATSVSNAISAIFTENKIKSNDVVTSVSGHAVIVKRIAVAAASEEEVGNAVQYEAQQYIPFDMADVSMDYQVLGPAPTGNAMDVMLVAVKREKIQNLMHVLGLAGKTAAIVDIDAFALQNAYEANYDPAPEQMAALLNIGASIMNINIVRGGVPLFTRDVSVGGNQYTDTLQKELDLSYDDAEKLKQGQELPNVTAEARDTHIRSVSEILLLEIQKTFDFFRQTTSTDNIQAIYIGGGTAKIQGLADLLREEFSIPVEILNPFKKVTINPSRFDQAFTADVGARMSVAVGLALRSFDTP